MLHSQSLNSISSNNGRQFKGRKSAFHPPPEGRGLPGARGYRLQSISARTLGLDYEELHYLSVCRELGADLLSEHVRKRIDETIMSLSMQMADPRRDSRSCSEPKFAFYAKGRIGLLPPLRNHQHSPTRRGRKANMPCAIPGELPQPHQRTPLRSKPDREHEQRPLRTGAGVTKDFSEVRHLTNLAVHRIVSVRVSEHTFTFDLPACSANSFGLPWHEPWTFKIRFSSNCAGYIRERIWADEQSLEDTEDGGVILELTTRSEPGLMAWVRSLGDDAQELGQPTT